MDIMKILSDGFMLPSEPHRGLIVSGPTPNKALFKELVAPPWGL